MPAAVTTTLEMVPASLQAFRILSWQRNSGGRPQCAISSMGIFINCKSDKPLRPPTSSRSCGMPGDVGDHVLPRLLLPFCHQRFCHICTLKPLCHSLYHFLALPCYVSRPSFFIQSMSCCYQIFHFYSIFPLLIAW